MYFYTLRLSEDVPNQPRKSPFRKSHVRHFSRIKGDVVYIMADGVCVSVTGSICVRVMEWMRGLYFHWKLYHIPPGGGGGVLRFGSDGGVPLKPPNQYLSFGGKGYLLLRVFSQENDVFVYFSDEMGENYKSGGYV